MAVITIWGDMICPWAYVTVLRLHHARDHLGADSVVFDAKARLRELAGMSRTIAERHAELAVAAQLEPTGFSNYEAPSWPASSLPAFEAQKWGQTLGDDIGESFDLALRRALFLHGHDISLRQTLLDVAASEGLAVDSLAEALDGGRHRRRVMEEAAEGAQGRADVVEVVLPDGSSHLDPGMEISWVRGIPIVQSDHPVVFEELVEVAAVAE